MTKTFFVQLAIHLLSYTHCQDSVINDAEESMEGLKNVPPIIPPTASSAHCCREERKRKPTETNYVCDTDQTGTFL